MSLPGGFITISNNFMKSKNYINKKGEHPEISKVFYWDDLTFKKEDLTDNNWFYFGDNSEKEKLDQISAMKLRNGIIPILIV